MANYEVTNHTVDGREKVGFQRFQLQLCDICFHRNICNTESLTGGSSWGCGWVLVFFLHLIRILNLHATIWARTIKTRWLAQQQEEEEEALTRGPGHEEEGTVCRGEMAARNKPGEHSLEK